MFVFFTNMMSQEKSRELELWYEQPARDWNEALPVGNGRLGAMVYGGVQVDTIQFNEESLWAGSKLDCNNPKAGEYLDTIRQLIFEDKNREAYDLAEKYLLGTPPRFRSYQIFGNIAIEYEMEENEVKSYKRSLNLPRGVSFTNISTGNDQIEREVFASTRDDLLVIHVRGKKKGGLHAKISMTRSKDSDTKALDAYTLAMQGQVVDEPKENHGSSGKHMKFASILKVLSTDGTTSIEGESIQVKGANEFTIVVSAHTDYNRSELNFDRSINPLALCREDVDRVKGISYENLKKNHVKEHQPVFERMELIFEGDQYDTIPTDLRLKRVQEGKTDNGLIALYFQYGRYLLMGSSGFFARLPANLQGIWNNHLEAPWNSDFHTNINIQMNYWPAEVCNLSETTLPYIEFFNEIRTPGRVTAQKMYGAGGWTMHHATNVFGYTAINAAVKYGMFPMAASWVCFPAWRHYEFTRDEAYLENQAWPIMKEAVQFILDFLVESPEGYLVTNPSYSPENSFYLPGEDSLIAQLSYAPTMDIMIINEIFKYSLEAIDILGEDEELKNKILATREKLPPIQIGADGTIQEWIKDYQEPHPWHRHISHLIALHPGTQITQEDSELFDAAKKTIEKRLRYGGGHTGWSRAWIINFYARLLDGDEAYQQFIKLLQKSTLSNLFDTHPPFQIDGNLGAPAGIAEMLVQSHTNYIEILPAWTQNIPTGRVKGICARGGFELSFSWKDNELEDLEVLSKAGQICKLRYKNKVVEFDTEPGKVYSLNNILEVQ